MIFFMIKENSPDCCIPLVSEEEITESNIQLISWTQALYEGESLSEVNKLKNAVFHAAQKDPLCNDINAQFEKLYKINILGTCGSKDTDFIQVIDTVFDSWASPMIGNIMASPHVRAQTENDQYVQNWEKFPAKYMSDETKGHIHDMLQNPNDFGLKKLEKSGHDQVRICKDMTELARAVMGEISTYVTRKLEKIYALELCASDRLLAAQRALIKEIIGAYGELKEKFSIEGMQYLSFYFPEVGKWTEQDALWKVFVCFVDSALGEKSGLTYESLTDDKERQIQIAVSEFRQLPPVICCAMIINSIRKTGGSCETKRYSLQGVWTDSFAKVQAYCITEAADKNFVPKLSINKKRVILLWSWNRDEKHVATMTYRCCLMPLWAGPSGHATGILEFFTRCLGELINVDGAEIPVTCIVLPAMFAFWRLYYDKRITGVHTLAETFEASFSLGLHSSKDGLDASKKNERDTLVNEEMSFLEHQGLSAYGDVFDTLVKRPDGRDNMSGIINPVRIMAQIRKKYYDETAALPDAVGKLDKQIEAGKQNLAARGYVVPEWSKPVSHSGTGSGADASALRGIAVTRFTQLNVRTFSKMVKKLRTGVPVYADCLLALYGKISVQDTYCFADDFAELPRCIIGGEWKPFLSEVVFTEISNVFLDEKELTFTAKVRTDAEFWNEIHSAAPVEETEMMDCRIMEDVDGIHFAGRIGINSKLKITDRLSVGMKQIVLNSSLSQSSSLPYVYAEAELGEADNVLAVKMTLPPGGCKTRLSGEYEGGKVVTINRLLSLLGVEELIPVSALLPAEESVFGSLGLRDISVEFFTDSFIISNIAFTITAEKPWNIFEHKITLQPYLEINMEYPFDESNRQTDYTVLGKWRLGTAVFDLSYNSQKIIYAKLADDSILDFEEAAALFAPNVAFPAIKLTDMELTADAGNQNYSLRFYSEDILSFGAGRAELGIQDISLGLDFRDGRFGELLLCGTFILGGFSLHLTGEYGADHCLMFEAMAYSDLDYSLGDFVKQIAEDLSGTYNPDIFPEEFLTVSIRSFVVSYQSQDSRLGAEITLEHVLEISDKFAIRDLSLKISTAKNSPLTFDITAAMDICGTRISLLLAKVKEGFRIEGCVDLKNLSLDDIFREIGIDTSGMPDFIKEFEFTESHAEVSVFIGNKQEGIPNELELMISCDYGKVICRIRQDVKTGNQYLVKTELSERIEFSKLPLIEDFHFCDHCGISELAIAAASDGWNEQTIHKGLTINGNIYNGEDLLPFCWSTEQEEKEGILYRSFGLGRSIPVNWVIGTVHIRNLILGYRDSAIWFGIDAGIALGLLAVDFNNLQMGYRLKDRTLGIDLDGLALSAQNKNVNIEGSLYHVDENAYTGTLRVQFARVGMHASASYRSGEYTSVFGFAMLRGTLGGPPCFMLTGIGAGIGYSRELTVPDIEKLDQFALLNMALGKTDVSSMIKDVDKEFRAKQGSNWLAAGITANSFNMVELAVLLTAQMDKKLVMNILGRAEISIPHAVEEPVAHAGLLMKVTIDPDAGYVPVDGILSRDAYVLSKKCHLSGGFAFYCWYAGTHAGDFVISLGGYHNQYRKPDHYPSPQRLKLAWKLSNELYAEGSLYFALTPSAIMAGGDLQMTFSWKCVKAWFHAYVNILMCWKPYHYDFEIGISLKINVNLFLFKLDLELGCDLAIWGPDFTGTANIHLWIISFSISFGKASRGNEKLDIKGFRTAFLPAAGQNDGKVAYDAVSLAFAGGVIDEQGTDDSGIKIVCAQQLQIQVDSRVPVAYISFNGQEVSSGDGSNKICLRPCSTAEEQVMEVTTLVIELKRCDETEIGNSLEFQRITAGVPAALWAEKAYAGETVKQCIGLQIKACGFNAYRRLAFMEECREDEGNYNISSPVRIGKKAYDQAQAYEKLGELKDKQEELKKRFRCMPGAEIDLEEFTHPQEIFRAAPLLANIEGHTDG